LRLKTTVLDLAEFQQTLPEAPKSLANYVPFSKTGNLVITAGILPLDGGQLAFTGRLENDQDIAKGQQAARLACLNALSVLKLAIGDLSKVKQVIKLNGYVSSHPDFFEQPSVLNGASDLLVDAFGEDIGKHARAAVGVASLPKNATIEVELIVEVLP
jgi:enamine deaminase RidA (YjgF/YER057c/UK114 family)